MSRLQNEVFFSNKNILSVMSYLSKNTNKFGCYLDLKFDLSIDETMAVATTTRNLC